MEMKIKSVLEADLKGKRVLFRPDVNSPVNAAGEIVNDNRIRKTVPTLQFLAQQGARIAIIAHQGDTLDYPNLCSMAPHAARLSALSGVPIRYLDDVCGDAALAAVDALQPGEGVFLGNLRYLTEEVSTFEKDVKLTPQQMESCYLVRRLAPHFDVYVNDAFAAAHRASPSMTAFQRLLPSYAGPLFFKEYETLYTLMHAAAKPTLFVLGGAKISDAFGMMQEVLANGSADKILAVGVTGIVMRLAQGYRVGARYEQWLADRDLLPFVEQGKKLLASYADRFCLPVDLAYERGGARVECKLEQLPIDDVLFLDVGAETVKMGCEQIARAGTVFVNGPAGVYEDPLFAYGTDALWHALADTKAHTVIGGGDSVAAAQRFNVADRMGYVCTAGGAMVRFLSGKRLPLIEAMENSK